MIPKRLYFWQLFLSFILSLVFSSHSLVASSSLNKAFFMPSLQVGGVSSMISPENYEKITTSSSTVMGMFMSSYYVNYRWSGLLLALKQHEQSFTKDLIDYSYTLFQGTLSFQLKKNIKLEFSPGSFIYDNPSPADTSQAIELDSSYLKSTIQYYLSPSSYLKTSLKQSTLDYNDGYPKQTKDEYSLGHYPFQFSRYVPSYGVTLTTSDSSETTRYFSSLACYFSSKHSLVTSLYSSKTAYLSSDYPAYNTVDLSLAYTYKLSSSLSVLLNVDKTFLEDEDDTSKISLSLSYFGSFNRLFKPSYTQRLPLMVAESRRAIRRGHYKRAKNILTHALYLYPYDDLLRMDIAYVFHHLKQESTSNKHLDIVLRHDPSRLDALYLKARNHINLQLYSEALDILYALYQLNPDDEIQQLIDYTLRQKGVN